MKLTYVKKHLSVDQFDDFELPDFAVLTGMNGSGKTHLLQAINNGSITVSGLSRLRKVLFTQSEFQIDPEQPISAQTLAQERTNA